MSSILQARPQHVRKYRSYHAENLIKAFEDVTSKGLSVSSSARLHDVPEQTLRDRVKGNVDPFDFRRETLFTKEEEEGLVEHLEALAQLGYGATNQKVQDLAGELAHALGKKVSPKPMSKCWRFAFLKRWGDRIKSIRPRALDTNRAKSATPEKVDMYFSNLETTLRKYDLQHKPQFIYNLDETGIHPEHRPPNVIAPLHGKTQSVTSPRSTTTTIIGCANAAGQFLPPFFVFKGKRFNADLMKGASPGCKGVMTESGWSNFTVFQQYIKEHFLPNIARDDNQHVLLIFDGHSSHVSKMLIEWAAAQKLILFVLPAHTSHILQPLDVGIFGPFKRFYYGECANYMRENIGQAVTKYDMVNLSCKAYLKAMTPINIMSAFKKSGIYPLDKHAVTPEKLYPTESYRDKNPLQKIQAMKRGKDAIEEYLSTKYEKKLTENSDVTYHCPCCTKGNSRLSKPSAGGKAITESTFIEEITAYETEKEQKLTKKSDKNHNKNHKNKSHEEPSTSGINNNNKKNNNAQTQNDAESDSDMDTDDISDSDLCCVCHKFSPPNLNDRPYLKIVSWAQCTTCNHWVHLSFCHRQTVVRRGDTFLCHHCTI